MVIQLSKRFEDGQLNSWREKLVVTFGVLNSTPLDRVVSINMGHEELGGTFEVVLENYFNSYSFQENDYVRVLEVGNTVYYGVIHKILSGISRNGVVLKVTGVLTTPGLRYSGHLSFSSADPFLRPDGSFIPTPLLPVQDNTYRLFGLSGQSVLDVMSQRSGIPIFNSLPFDYPIWEYQVGGGNVGELDLMRQTRRIDSPGDLQRQGYAQQTKRPRMFQAMDEIAKHAGANAVLRFNNSTAGIQLIPWGTGVNTFEYHFDDLIDGIEPGIERTEFTDVQLEPSSDVTPWNSTYAGLPESIGQVTFKSGSISLTDLSNGGQQDVQKNSDWIYPTDEFLGNIWVKYLADPAVALTQIVRDLGCSAVWDAVSENKLSLSYKSVASYHYHDVIGDRLAEFEKEHTISEKPRDVFVYNILYRWKTAVKKFESQGDIAPDLIVMPSDVAPKLVDSFNLNSANFFNVMLYGYGLHSSNVDGTNHPQVGRITPLCYSVPVYKDQNLTTKGFDEDGSFWIGLQTHNSNWAVRTSGEFHWSYSPESLQIMDTGFTITVLPDPRELPIVTAAQRARPEIDSRTQQVITQDKVALIEWKPLQQYSEELKKERIKKIAELKRILERSQDSGKEPFDMIVLPEWMSNPQNSQSVDIGGLGSGRRHFLMLAYISVDEGTKLKVVIDALPKKPVNRISLQVARSIKNGILGRQVEPVEMTMTQAPDSGTVDQAAEPLEGSWTLYALKRRTYTPKILCPIGNGQPMYAFNGTLPYQPVNPKVVGGSLVTDYWRSGGHAEKLIRALSVYLDQDFYSFNIRVPYKGGSIPQVGDIVKVSGIPNLNSFRGGATIESKVTQVSFSADFSSGAILTINCGRLSIL